MRVLVSLAIVSMVSVSPLGAQDPREWDDLYREAIVHVSQQQWKLAEDKLRAAIKSGPPSGRGVIRRRVFNRDDYFPEFYLGIVYLHTNRPAEARTQFSAARKGNIPVAEREFERLPEYEARTRELLDAAAKERATAKPVPAQQFRVLIDQAQRLLKESRYDDAENAARAARGMNIDNGAVDELLGNIARSRANARLQEALKGSPSLADLRRLLSEYEDSGASVEEVRKRIAAAETVQRRDTAERAAMIAYYAGNYSQSIAALSEAERSGAGLSARGQFYRAVTLASQATRGKAPNQTQLREARKAWTIANERADEFKADLRYISPQILQLLRGS